MSFALSVSLLAAGLFLAILLVAEGGRRAGAARLARDPDGLPSGVGAAVGAVFGLLGLMIALTFSGAWSRFEARRHLVTDEANAIGTAYLRLDLLPGDAQPELRELFRRYADLRFETYRDVADVAATNAKLLEGAVLQREIWTKAHSAARRSEAAPQAVQVLLPALNVMFDIVTTRVMASRNHAPMVVFLLLAGLGLLGSLLIGYDTSGNKGRPWLQTVVYAGIVSLVFYVILDLEFPRLGLIQVGAADQLLVELRNTMR